MTTRTKTWLLSTGLLGALMVLGLPAPASAGQVVVGKFSGGRTGRGARNALASALEAKGIGLESYSGYLRTARSQGYRKSRAFSRRAIRSVARRMGLAGVVTGSATRSRGRTYVTVKLYGPNGRLWMKETVRGRRSGLSRKTAAALADEILHHVGSDDAQDPAPRDPIESDPIEPDPTPVADDSPDLEPAPNANAGDDSGWGESLLGGNEGYADSAPAPEPKPAPEPASTSTGAPAWAAPPRPRPRPAPAAEPARPPETKTRAPRRRRSKDERVDDAWLAVGTGVHLRSGLEPLHTTGAFPGLRFDGRLFFRPFLDRGIWADLGVGLNVDFSLGLAYRYRGEDTWYDASQTQWRFELLYRWAQRAEWVPSLILKLGVNGTHSSVSGNADYALNVSYLGPHLGLDAVWNLHGPLLRGVVTLDVLVAAVGDDLDATGGGVHLFLGLQSVVLGWFQLDVGYDLTYYGFDDSGTGSSSDTYHAVLVRLGYVYK